MEKKNEKTIKFEMYIEQAAFKLAAMGKKPTALDAVKLALLDEWKWGLKEVAAATKNLKALKADLAKPEMDPANGGSAVRYWGCFIWYEKPYPPMEDMVKAYERGVKRYEAAMKEELPDDWTWTYNPPDAFLARFPEQIDIKGTNPTIIRFWMTAYDGQLQTNVLYSGQVISPPWYAHQAYVGYGDTRYQASGDRIEIGKGENRSRADYKFVCPTPAELLEHLKKGGTLEELLEKHISPRWEKK